LVLPAVSSSVPQRVLIVNDDAFELSSLSAALRLHSVNVIGEAQTIPVAQNLFKSLQPDVVIIDIQFCGEEGVALARSLRKDKADLGIILMTSCPDLRLLGLKEKDIPLGSKIILKKSIADLLVIKDSIKLSINSLTTKEKMAWVDSHGSLHENAFTSVLSDFTDIQIETLRLLATGLSNAEIGRTRFVSEKSVEQIVARIAQHFNFLPDRTKNLRVLITGEYFKWLGAPRH
jgi:DNA-binding NarL/FixJ family response regulator